MANVGSVLIQNEDESFTLKNMEDGYIVGGFRSVVDLSERNFIPEYLRKEGMVVFVQETKEVFKLDSGLTNYDWIYFTHILTSNNLSDLASVNDNGLPERISLRVLTVDDNFVLYKNSIQLADGITVVNSFSSNSGEHSGRWIREPSYSMKFLSQRTWNVDPASGDDESDGYEYPLKTFKELNRRVWAHIGGGRYLINVLSTPVLGDPPRFLGSYHSSVSPSYNISYRNDDVVFKGSYTTVATGTISAATALSSTTNEIWSITDSSKTWSTYIRKNYAIRFTSGTLNGCFAFPMEDLSAVTAGKVAITDPYLDDRNLTTRTTLIPTTAPANGTTYEIVQFMDCAEVEFSRKVSSTNPYQVFEYFNFTGENLAPQSPLQVTDFNQGTFSTQFYHCVLGFIVVQTNEAIGASFSGCNFIGTSSLLENCWTVSTRSRGSVFKCGFHSGIVITGKGTTASMNSCYMKYQAQVTIDAHLNILIQNTFVGPNGGAAIYADNGAYITIQSNTTLVGSKYDTLFKISNGAKIRAYYATLSKLSFVSLGPLVTFDNNFAYAFPPNQPVNAPVLQPLTAIPSATNLSSLNTAPWKLPAVGSQMSDKIVLTGADTETKLTIV